IGELYLRGPNVALGYWMNETATRDTFGVSVPGAEGSDWLRTGDCFIADQDGNLWFVDRLKDVMKILGTQVTPGEIEEAIHRRCQKFVSEVSVVGVNASSTEELVPRAFVVLSGEGRRIGEEKCVEMIDAAVCAGLSKPKWLVGGIQFVDAV
ncbi:uncharacterized protein EI90DRAFT_2818774, partial [Cantharellus anzutake]|uniref:uncharacterized protein n=1 Tax=Cantharellus anzutake TaxID=1750568 RepID=UPI0019049943